MFNKLLPLILLIIGAVLGASGVLLFKNQLPVTTPLGTPNQTLGIDPYFESQTAVIQGIVTKIEGGKIAISNNKNSSVKQFTFATNANISKPTGGVATGSAGLALVKPGDVVVATAQAMNGDYQIISLSTLGPIPSPSPAIKNVAPRLDTAPVSTPSGASNSNGPLKDGYPIQ